MSKITYIKFTSDNWGEEILAKSQVYYFTESDKKKVGNYFSKKEHFDFSNYDSIDELIAKIDETSKLVKSAKDYIKQLKAIAAEKGNKAKEYDEKRYITQFQSIVRSYFFAAVLSFNTSPDDFDWLFNFRKRFRINFLPSHDDSNEGFFNSWFHDTFNKNPDVSKEILKKKIIRGIKATIDFNKRSNKVIVLEYAYDLQDKLEYIEALFAAPITIEKSKYQIKDLFINGYSLNKLFKNLKEVEYKKVLLNDSNDWIAKPANTIILLVDVLLEREKISKKVYDEIGKGNIRLLFANHFKVNSGLRNLQNDAVMNHSNDLLKYALLKKITKNTSFPSQ